MSEESYTTFNPLLPEAVGASIFPEQVVAPLREMLIFVEWTWGMFFPTDITHLRFSGSQALAVAEREDQERASSLPARG